MDWHMEHANCAKSKEAQRAEAATRAEAAKRAEALQKLLSGGCWTWYWLSYEQQRPVDPSNWRRYDADVERRLNEAVQSLIRWRGKVGPTGRILDLSAFSDHKCEVWSVEPVIVQNPSVGPMKGRRTALG